ncbi:MAG: hypothetical protein Q4C70_08610 [Planctomycetia bacterium]|nr:hypothetical protein [Planctomycetia bacterium]
MTENRLNWKWGDTSPIAVTPAPGARIHIGDLLWLDETGKCWPASEYPREETADTRRGFARRFIGVAMQESKAGRVNPIRVATAGTFEFSLEGVTAPLILGMHVAPAFQGTGLSSSVKKKKTQGAGLSPPLKPQTVTPTDEKDTAIGWVAHTEDVKDGKAVIRVISSLLGRWDL